MKKKKNQCLDKHGGGGGGRRQERGGGRERETQLTQDEVVLRQLSVSDLFVERAAGVQVHVSHEAAAVEVFLHLCE